MSTKVIDGAAGRIPHNRRHGIASRAPDRGAHGPPPGLSLSVLEDVARTHGGIDVEAVRHEHLSNWKPAGAFRVVVCSRSGRQWTAVFKNAHYGLDNVPAQQDLPATIGRPEFAVLGSDPGPLTDFLPAVYWAHRAGPQAFQYLMEDLNWSWCRPASRRDVLRAAATLPAMHARLRERFASDRTGLITYDERYARALRSYVRESVERYLARHPDDAAGELWTAWHHLATAHTEAAPPWELASDLIHGDFNPSNVYFHWGQAKRIKAVDWEWAGVGLPHTDLASILKSAPANVQRRAVDAHARRDQTLSPSEHLAAFAWCRLHDAIRDAGYVAAQFLDFSHVPQVEPTGYLVRSLRRAQDAIHLLENPAWQ